MTKLGTGCVPDQGCRCGPWRYPIPSFFSPSAWPSLAVALDLLHNSGQSLSILPELKIRKWKCLNNFLTDQSRHMPLLGEAGKEDLRGTQPSWVELEIWEKSKGDGLCKQKHYLGRCPDHPVEMDVFGTQHLSGRVKVGRSLDKWAWNWPPTQAWAKLNERTSHSLFSGATESIILIRSERRNGFETD